MKPKISPDYQLFEKHNLNTDCLMELHKCRICEEYFSVWDMELEPEWKCYGCLDKERGQDDVNGN